MVFGTPSVSTAIGIPALIVLLTNYKSLPFAYMFRSYFLARSLTKQVKAKGLEPEPLFGIVSQKHKCLYDDIDFNFHMNNGSYNKMLDFARIHILFTVLPRVMVEPEHGVSCFLSSVLTMFRKEIKPLSEYTVQSRIWTWDKKWMWVQHRFVLADGTLAAVCVSKLVFKKAFGKGVRKTIPPEQVFELCGHDLSDPAVEQRRQKNWELAEGLLKMDALNNDTYTWDGPHVLPAAKL